MSVTSCLKFTDWHFKITQRSKLMRNMRFGPPRAHLVQKTQIYNCNKIAQTRGFITEHSFRAHEFTGLCVSLKRCCRTKASTAVSRENSTTTDTSSAVAKGYRLEWRAWLLFSATTDTRKFQKRIEDEPHSLQQRACLDGWEIFPSGNVSQDSSHFNQTLY